VAFGWDRGLKDEGSAAHIFQLLIAGQIPFVVAFLVTANWGRFIRIAVIVGLQIVAIALALGPVAYFNL